MSVAEQDFETMPQDEFVRRFTAELVRLVGPTHQAEDEPEPQSTAGYAETVAISYYETKWQRVDGPEECARADHSYWGE